MPELRNNPIPTPSTVEQPSQVPHGYRITRKGSRYNIIGPEGRIFIKNKSASVAGPRWEELTHTPWPYPSSAYEPGLRLWELDIITREELSDKQAAFSPAKPQAEAVPSKTEKKPRERKPSKSKVAQPAKSQASKTASAKAAAPVKTAAPAKAAASAKTGAPAKAAAPVKTATPAAAPAPTAPVSRPIDLTPPLLALPAPKIDLKQQTQIITALRKNPSLLFRPEVRTALKNEVDYHRPYAAWAANLLKVLTRYDARQRSHVKSTSIKQETILARHIAWQEHQLQLEQLAVNH